MGGSEEHKITNIVTNCYKTTLCFVKTQNVIRNVDVKYYLTALS